MKKFAIILISLVLILLISVYVSQKWLENNLVSLINENPNRAYDITYENLDLNIFFKGFDLEIAHITPLTDQGTLINGKVFDSSYKRGKPATFPLNGVIKGWQEVLPMMPQGSKWKVFIPSELAYGTRGAGGDIGPNETLIFDIELMEIK